MEVHTKIHPTCCLDYLSTLPLLKMKLVVGLEKAESFK